MISVVIPALNEAKTIHEVVSFCFTSPLVKEVIVIDDGSIDNTVALARDAGADVYISSMLGKGASMHDGLLKAKQDIVLYIDGDIFNFSNELIELMVSPLLKNECDLVKGKFQRKAGRVTILTARPMLKAFFPELAAFEQPLGGVIAGKKELLNKLEFESDYGVDIGLLIDAYKANAKIQEISIGYLDHEQQSLECLSNMSNQIVRTILDRAEKYKKLDTLHIQDSYELQRLNEYDLQMVCEAIDTDKKLALFDMDGTIIKGRFIEELAKQAHKTDELKLYLDSPILSDRERTEGIARIFKGVNQSIFIEVAKTIPLFPEVQETIIALKKKGYCIGIITDSYFIAAEVIRKRIFAHFSVAHLLGFSKGICSGDITISPFMQREQDPCHIHQICKSNFLTHIKQILDFKQENVRYIGDGLNDICMLMATEQSITINPKSKLVSNAAKNQIEHFSEINNIWA